MRFVTQGVFTEFRNTGLDLLNKLLERNKANLRRRGYNEENAAITREEFRQQLARRGRISLQTAGEIEASLYNAQKIEFMGGYVRPKVGES